MKFRSAEYCIIRISIFLILIGVLVYFLFDALKNAFMYNIQINSVILCGFAFGIFFIFNRLFLYEREYVKLLSFDRLKKDDIEGLKLIAPISFYASRSSQFVTQTKLNSMMASIEKRVEDCGAFPKYISGVLIFLGLFGTFWGLSHTIGNVANIIDTLGIDQSDATESFSKLKDSLRIPLSGMGVAFGCSLFGLSGSLILGFLNINQKRVADKFLYKVEEWITKRSISLDTLDGKQEYHGPAYSMGLMEKTIEMIYAFQNQLKEFELNRISLLSVQKDFSAKLSQLTEAISINQDLVQRVVSGQSDIKSFAKNNETAWTEMIQKLDDIEKSLSELVRSTISGREYITNSLGDEIRMVSKTLSSLIRE